ncbi:MAG TPA: metallophosphoesterase [Polyangia bacterium]|jgi:Calcineurin-like phosphoesterase.|nr:metallophosphoesterase [Polyangia bacterium]
MQRTIVVGDVHGCLDELQTLLRQCGVVSGDRVVLAGDLVAKGPDSRGVVQLVREIGALAVLGNHDDYCIDVWRRRHHAEARRPRRWMLDTLDDSDWAFLESLPLFLRLGAEREEGPEVAVVHAGAVPGVPLEEQERENLLSLRSLVGGSAPSRRLLMRWPWAAAWRGPEHIVFGHDAVRGLQQYPLATGLDTGCVYGRELTALELPSRHIYKVPARRRYVGV